MTDIQDIHRERFVKWCQNCYEKKGRGVHGRTDWSNLTKVEQYEYKNLQFWTAVYHWPDTRKKSRVISWRGSDENADWESNFNIEFIHEWVTKNSEPSNRWGRKDSEIFVHRGVEDLYSLGRSTVRKIVDKSLNAGMDFINVGHSLGGMLETKCYSDIMYMVQDEMGVHDIREHMTGYSAASARIMNVAGVRSFDRRAQGTHYREFFGNDPVVDLPSPLFGYAHVGKCKQWWDWATIVKGIPVRIPQMITLTVLPSIDVGDHDPRLLYAAVRHKKIPFPCANTDRDE